MRYLPILFILLLFGCQPNSNIQKQIELQESFIDNKYHLLLSDFHLKYTVNPAKYMGLYDYVEGLKERFDALEKELLLTDGYGDKSKEIVFNYYKMVESGLTHGYLEDEFKKCKSCINDILLGKSLTMQERKMTVLFLKTFNTTLIENVIENETWGDFKFNVIRPIIVSDRNKLKMGETYEARVMLVAMDTTRHPIYKIENALVEYGLEGEGIVRFKTNKRGVQKWGGSLIWQKEDGIELELDFEQTYIVE